MVFLNVVEEFVSILLSVPIKESSTITMICDDALSSAIDSRKFAAEFCARRRADLEGRGYDGGANGGGGDWSVVGGGKAVSSSNVATATASASLDHAPASHGGDGFEVVGKKKKKGK